MAFRTEKFEFENRDGLKLAGRLEWPQGEAQAFALFAHCFTCSKDVAAASRIARALSDLDVAVLRFDFTGLGNSDGDFANTNFSSNVQDLLDAAEALKEQHSAPQILIGHSLGGAAVLAAASQIETAKAVVTIGAPSDTRHVQNLFGEAVDEIKEQGEAEVDLAGRKFTIKKQFIEDTQEFKLDERIQQMKSALLIFHSPQDNTVSIEHARHIYEAALHPKSFVTLDGADHLLTKKEDSHYVAGLIGAWAKRYLPVFKDELEKGKEGHPKLQEGELLVRSRGDKFSQDVYTHDHYLVADEPTSVGGKNLGMTPYGLLKAALGTCTSMTLRMYSERKGWPLERAEVKIIHDKIHAQDCEDCEDDQKGKIDIFQRELKLVGDLDSEQREKLKEIADKCPVHKTLKSDVQIKTTIAEE